MLTVLVLTAPSAAQTPAAIRVSEKHDTVPSLANFTKLADFGNGNGQYPNAPLAQGTDGNFYGTTLRGPYPSNGFAFKMTPAGKFSAFDYACTTNDCTGSQPYAGLVLASDGTFYGSTLEGGNGAYRSNRYPGGTLFKLSPENGLTTIYNFCSEVACDDGYEPFTPLTQGSDGNLYGVTPDGGVNGLGTVFEVTTTGELTTLHDFASTEGTYPDGGVIQAGDGNFYGTTAYGGANCSGSGCGTIFQLTPEGTLNTLYSFCQQTNCADGYYPAGGLIQGTDGNLYGVTRQGGISSAENPGGYGTVFKVTTAGVFASLYSFCVLTNCADGEEPTGILQATDGNFYGATPYGGASPFGTLFKLTPAGALTTLHNFCTKGGQHCTDGEYPGPLVQATDGNFYGVAYQGGQSSHGTAYKVSVGLSAFVETVTASGAVGSSVIILGTNLTGASKVTFNGTATAFTLVSSTDITATVPTGATTGPIVVTTPKGTFKSNKNFLITQ
ncbi:MAG: choice-of-anchor tandem repeat GloVer-containing protein [Candidatus Sulfotelmatobacter sp.]